MAELPSTIVKLADLLSALPGIGPKQATRLAIHLIGYNPSLAKNLSHEITVGLDKVRVCENCGNLAESELCYLCADPDRDNSVVMVVEGITDLIALESAQQFKGIYCVLGKLISPLNGVMPEDTNLDLLLKKREAVQEVIFALPANVEGEATIAYITQAIEAKDTKSIKITRLARGIAKGVNMEYLDPDTLRAALTNRI